MRATEPGACRPAWPGTPQGHLCALLLLAAAGAAQAAARDRYGVALAADLARLTVVACAAPGATALVARARDAARYLHHAHRRSDGEPLAPIANRLPLSADDGCVEYRVDLRAASRARRGYEGLAAGNLAVPIPLWLWRAQGDTPRDVAIEFVLPPGARVAVPWPATDDSGLRYRIPASPESDEAISVFGAFDSCGIAIGGATLRAAILRGRVAGDPGALAAWIGAAAGRVVLSYGRFPNPAPQVIVVPTAKSRFDGGEPVPFGRVIRDGGEAVQFFVNQRRPPAAFDGDWTATHEFGHLLLPYVEPGGKWLAEGLASYYQNVLMARAAAYDPATAWRKILEGLERGEASVPALSIEQAMALGGWNGIMKTYWGGAALFLLADVALREQSAGARTLDSVLDALQRCCLPSSRSWSGAALAAELDRLAGVPLFEPLYQTWRASRTLPDYAPRLAELGIAWQDGRLAFDDGAPLAAIRRAIMAPVAAPTPNIHCRNAPGMR